MSVRIIGDISIAPRTRFPPGLDVRSGSDGRNRVIVPESDRLALAQAIAGDAYRVVAVSELWDYCDSTWTDIQTGTAADGEGDVVHADEPRSAR